MTSNRARKRAARAIAAEKNIRYPEADALADPKLQHSPLLKVPALSAEEKGRPALDPADLQRVRIVFALGYADLLSAGLEDKKTLDLLASSPSASSGFAAKTLAAAIPEVRKALEAGSTQGIAWASCKNLVGAHLYYMLQISDAYGPAPRMLRATAERLDAELRLGVF